MSDRSAPPPGVRPARPDEFGHLRRIEDAADRRFEALGIGPFTEDTATDRLASAAAVFAVGDPAVGFVSITVVDGAAHVDQVSVLPEHGRRGLGRALVEAAVAWAADSGFGRLTLTTYRDVPFNAPFYRTLGFDELPHPGPELSAVRARERELGDDQFGVRIAMVRPLGPPA